MIKHTLPPCPALQHTLVGYTEATTIREQIALISPEPSITASNKRLLVVGAAHVDDIALSLNPLVPQASNSVTWERRLGGVAANAAIAAALTAGSDATIPFLAAVGDDAAARQIELSLRQYALEPHLQFLPGERTGRYTAILDSDGELHIGLSDVVTAELLRIDALQQAEAFSDIEAVLVDANLSSECLAQLIDISSELKIPITAMSVSPAKSLRLLPLARAITVLFCNRREALAMCPHLSMGDSLNTLADGLMKLGFNQFVLTDGSSPLLVHDVDGRKSVPVPPIEQPQNVNGAGDALTGATFAAWACDQNLLDATTEHGLVAAARVVSGQRSAPRLD